ncbi:lamin tail domain-containing protein [bacterium]|nr:lamin tail domain-containing protein [bacterium]
MPILEVGLEEGYHLINRLLFFIAFLLLLGCGSTTQFEYDSLLNKQPYVIEVSPPNKSIKTNLEKVAVTFSSEVEPTSITETTFMIIENFENPKSQDQLDDFLDSNNYITVDGLYEVSENNKAATFLPNDPFMANITYGLVITTAVFSPEKIPFNQNPGSSPTMFWSNFSINDSAALLDEASGTSDNADGNANPDSGTVDKERFPAEVVINEIYYDAPGSDTDGVVFIELYGNPGDDISDYKLVLVNGDNGSIVDTITLPENSYIPDDNFFVVADASTGNSNQSNVTNADFIDNFDPQNGPDAIQLLDWQEKLVDAIGYGDGIIDLAENGLVCFEGTPAPDIPGGSSLSRLTAGLDTDDNSADFVVNETPTPGT